MLSFEIRINGTLIVAGYARNTGLPLQLTPKRHEYDWSVWTPEAAHKHHGGTITHNRDDGVISLVREILNQSEDFNVL